MRFKHAIICFVLLLVSITSWTQTRIKMKWENGWYTIPCVVNGLNLRAIYDSKVSVVNISISEAIFMQRNGYLQTTDILKSANAASTSDNSVITENSEVILRVLELGNLKLTNVRATIVRDMGAPLLFGQSLLQGAGNAQISGGELVISRGGQVPQQSAQQIQQQAQVQQQQVQRQQIQYPQAEYQTISVYKDNEIELSFYTDIRYEIKNKNLYHVWIRREYFNEYRMQYIDAFNKANAKEMEEQRLIHQKENRYFDPNKYSVDFSNFRYNWTLYIFDFSQKRFKMAHLSHYDNLGNVIKDTGYNFDVKWDYYVSAGTRMKTLYDKLYNYLF